MYHKDLPMWLWRAMQQRTEEPATWSLTNEDMEVIEKMSSKETQLMQHMALLAKQYSPSSWRIARAAIERAKKA